MTLPTLQAATKSTTLSKPNGSPQKGGQPTGQKAALKPATLVSPSFLVSRSTASRLTLPPVSRPSPRPIAPRRQAAGNRLDGAIVAGLLLLGNHLLLWVLLLGGIPLFFQVLAMQDAVQILQYQRHVAPVLRND